jgi:hypothetical protein
MDALSASTAVVSMACVRFFMLSASRKLTGFKQYKTIPPGWGIQLKLSDAPLMV